MKNSTSPVTTPAAEIQRDIDRLKTDLRQVGGDLSSVTQNAVNVARAGAAVVKDHLGDQLQAAAEKGQESAQFVRSKVAENPLMSLAAAFAVGIMLGVTVSRKG